MPKVYQKKICTAMREEKIHIFSENSQSDLHTIGNIVIIDESKKLILDKKEREKQMKCDMKEKERISNFCSKRCEDGRKKEV